MPPMELNHFIHKMVEGLKPSNIKSVVIIIVTVTAIEIEVVLDPQAIAINIRVCR